MIMVNGKKGSIDFGHDGYMLECSIIDIIRIILKFSVKDTCNFHIFNNSLFSIALTLLLVKSETNCIIPV